MSLLPTLRGLSLRGTISRPMSTCVRAPAPGGRLYAFGSSSEGRLGTSRTPKDSHIPHPVAFPSSSSSNTSSQSAPQSDVDFPRVQAISAGQSHAMALTSSGDVYLWGTLPGTGTTHLVPQKLDVALFKHSSPDSGVRSICAGPQSAAVVRSDGRLYTWGYGGSRLASLFGGGAGTLGHAAPLGNRRTPEFVAGLEHEDVVSVSLGHAHAAAVLSSGEAFVWGTGNWGRLGLGTSYSTRTPAYMLSLRGTPMADIQCGHTHSLGLGRDGSVWAWGKNDHFQLGAESSGTYFGGAGFDAHNVPTPLPFFADKPCSGVLASHYWSGAVTADGRAYLWGNRQMLAPTRIVLGRENEAAVGMSAGPMHVAVLGRSGRVYLLGRNGHGELGVARRGTRKEFVLAESVGFPVAAVACGGGFTMVVEQQGQTEGKTEAKTRERESVGESESGGEQAKSSEGAPENK